MRNHFVICDTNERFDASAKAADERAATTTWPHTTTAKGTKRVSFSAYVNNRKTATEAKSTTK